MRVEELRRAYDQFIEAARDQRFAAPADGGWSAELVLAHVIVGDRLIAQAAGEVCAGRQPTFDNRLSQSVPYLQTVVDAADGSDGLVEALRLCSRELIAVATRLTDEQAATLVPALIEHDGGVMVDEPRPVGSLVQAPAALHLAMHTEQLSGLRAG